MKKCNRCQKYKEDKEFIHLGKISKRCLKCLEDRKEQAKLYYERHKQRVSKWRSQRRLIIKYSLTLEDFKSLLKKQENKCLLCEGSFAKLTPCVDHDHKTNRVRGLLCRRCNLELQVVENSKFLDKAISYLKNQ